MTHKIHVLNLGCSKNQVDSENILGDFMNIGYNHVATQDESDIVVINTCGFIDSAKEESIDEIVAAVENRKPGQKVVVAGCLSQRYKDDLSKEIPEVDLFVGTYQPGEIIKLLEPEKSLSLLCDTTGSFSRKVLLTEEKHHAYLKIAEGCNRECSFCAIPGMRGKQKSRSIKSIIEEAHFLQEKGVKEISLVAQDLSYFGRERGGPESNLQELLQTLIQETDISWIRLMYAYPAFLDDSILQYIADQKRICSYIDMPIQHGSNKILQLMKRGHTRSSLAKLLNRMRSIIPDLALRTTLLLGFPGETEEDFQELLDLVQEVRFDRLGCFTYSDEEGTSAFELKEERVDIDIAMERAETLMNIQRQISLERNEKLVGQELTVLIDSIAEGSEYHYFARTEWDAPEVDNRVQIVAGDAQVGEFARVKIVDASEYDLDAIII